ncbi:MAG: Holliday junction resolvase RuvX [Pirellulales bacterium]
MSIQAQLPPGRLAGVDYGRRRIGIAVCDENRILASPLTVHETTGDKEVDRLFFQSLVTNESIVGFVIGLPIHSDGSDSRMSNEVERFAHWLGETIGLPFVFQDERYSSREATGLLAGVGLTRGKKKKRFDAVAAQVILDSWLESQKAGSAKAQGLSLDD